MLRLKKLSAKNIRQGSGWVRGIKGGDGKADQKTRLG